MRGRTEPKRNNGICEPIHRKDMQVRVMKSFAFICNESVAVVRLRLFNLLFRELLVRDLRRVPVGFLSPSRLVVYE
jgi:hypothetical protein